MSIASQNALKGYSYQKDVYLLFLKIMDSKREILVLDAEINNQKQGKTDHNFDDIKVKTKKNSYYIQTKNFKDSVSLKKDIKIEKDAILLKGNEIKFKEDAINILIISNVDIVSDDSVLGLPAKKFNDFYIISLNKEEISNISDKLYFNDTREIQIINFGNHRLSSANFQIKQEDLPYLTNFTTDLSENTIHLRDLPNEINEGILWYVGKPGVGKSHFVKELVDKFDDVLLYRFWIGPQDENIKSRRDFNEFINDIACSIFKSNRAYEIQELVNQINKEKPMIIIDGLDHVENYNDEELPQFIDFINKIAKARILVFSRELKHDISWKKKELDNWNESQTHKFLEKYFTINDENIEDKIYSISKGYPIITYFLAEQYLSEHKISFNGEISGLDEYYAKLIKKVDMYEHLSFFLLNESFFLNDEISLFCEDYQSRTIEKFISICPYLFKKDFNRISFIHDSLNTYLRRLLPDYLEINKEVLIKIRKSIENQEIRFLARIDSFNFDDEFLKKILLDYEDMKVFKELTDSNFDYESIQTFYIKLRLILKKFPKLFNITQYYATISILTIVNRLNKMLIYEEIYYHIINYLNENDIDENSIFSNGILWNFYKYNKNHDEKGIKEYLKELNYDVGSEFDLIKRNWKKEYILSLSDEKSLIETIKTPNNLFETEKYEFLINLILKTWIDKNKKSKLYKNFEEYLSEGYSPKVEKDFKDICSNLNIDYVYENELWKSKKIVQALKLENHELNDLNLKKLMQENNCEYSIEIYSFLLNYMRIYSFYDKLNYNIYDLNQFFKMYYFRKDYSVYTLNNALVAFEKQHLIDEFDSFDLINSVMDKSEKGIRDLLNDYLNQKDYTFIEKLNNNHKFDNILNYNLIELKHPRLNYISQNILMKIVVNRYLKGYNKNIDYEEIEELLKSCYVKKVSNFFKFGHISIINVPKKEIPKIEKFGFVCSEKKLEESEDFVRKPLDMGRISLDDLDYVIKQDLPCTEIAKYPSHFFFAFPYVELYEHYDKNDLKNNCMEIIYNSLFAKAFISGFQIYYAVTDLFLGNFPYFIDMIGYEGNWEELFKIFQEFINQSNISWKKN